MIDETMSKITLQPFGTAIKGYVDRLDEFIYPSDYNSGAAMSEFYTYIEGYERKGDMVGISNRISVEFDIWEYDIIQIDFHGKKVNGLMVFAEQEACFMGLFPEIPLWLPFSRMFEGEGLPANPEPYIDSYNYNARKIGTMYQNSELIPGIEKDDSQTH